MFVTYDHAHIAHGFQEGLDKFYAYFSHWTQTEQPSRVDHWILKYFKTERLTQNQSINCPNTKNKINQYLIHFWSNAMVLHAEKCLI